MSGEARSRGLMRPRGRGKAELLLLDARKDAGDDEDRGENGGPELQVQDLGAVVGLCGATDGCEQEEQNEVARVSVILPHGASLLVAAVQLGRGPHGEADEVLQDEEEADDDAEVAVDRVEVRAVAGELVVLDYGDASDEMEQSHKVEGGVDALAEALLLGGAGGLQRQDRLDEDEDGERLQQRVGGEEHQGLGEDRSPDDDEQDDGPELGDGAGACGRREGE